MHPVKAPEHDEHYAARQADCQDALGGKVQQLVEEAFRAGWSREETAEALLAIAKRNAKIVSNHTDNAE